MYHITKNGGSRTCSVASLIWIALFAKNYLRTAEDDSLYCYEYPSVHVERFSTSLLPKYRPIDAFSHLSRSRKKAQEIVRNLLEPSGGGNTLLLRCGDVKANPGPCADRQEPRLKKSDPKKMLRLAHLNARSLIRHFDDVACLVSSVRPEVLALSETWLDSSVGDGEL